MGERRRRSDRGQEPQSRDYPYSRTSDQADDQRENGAYRRDWRDDDRRYETGAMTGIMTDMTIAMMIDGRRLQFGGKASASFATGLCGCFSPLSRWAFTHSPPASGWSNGR